MQKKYPPVLVAMVIHRARLRRCIMCLLLGSLEFIYHIFSVILGSLSGPVWPCVSTLRLKETLKSVHAATPFCSLGTLSKYVRPSFVAVRPILSSFASTLVPFFCTFRYHFSIKKMINLESKPLAGTVKLLNLVVFFFKHCVRLLTLCKKMPPCFSICFHTSL